MSDLPDDQDPLPYILRPVNLGRPRPFKPQRLRDTLVQAIGAHHEQGTAPPASLIELLRAEDIAISDRLTATGKTQHKSGAGRPSSKTQYDEWHSRRKDLFRRLMKLPTLRLGQGYVKKELLGDLARELKYSVPPHKIVSAISHRLARNGLPVPDDSTIRRALKKLGLIRK